MQLRKWSFNDLCKFYTDYGLVHDNTDGSHFVYFGKINGKEVVAQAISNGHERKEQSQKTMKLAVKHTGIPVEYFEEWKSSKGKIIHEEIIG